MTYQSLLAALTTSALATGPAMASSVYVIDNLDLPTPVTFGARSNYQMQSFTPDVAGIGPSDTVAANSPVSSTVTLGSVTFLRSPDGGAGTAGQIFVDLYSGFGNSGTYLGSSTNSINLNATAALTEVTWNFSGIYLDSSAEYTFVFSTDDAEGNPATARLSAADNGSGFVNTYSGGRADDNADGSSPVPFDSRFQVSIVPTPSAALGTAAMLGVLGVRRRRRA